MPKKPRFSWTCLFVCLFFASAPQASIKPVDQKATSGSIWLVVIVVAVTHRLVARFDSLVCFPQWYCLGIAWCLRVEADGPLSASIFYCLGVYGAQLAHSKCNVVVLLTSGNWSFQSRPILIVEAADVHDMNILPKSLQVDFTLYQRSISGRGHV